MAMPSWYCQVVFLADRIGYRYTILVSLLAMTVITALMSTIDNYTYGWVLRFLLGIVSGPVQASCLSAIGGLLLVLINVAQPLVFSCLVHRLG